MEVARKTTRIHYMDPRERDAACLPGVQEADAEFSLLYIETVTRSLPPAGE